MSIRSFLARIRWFASGVMGADKYQKYLAHHRASGCTHDPMTEREFWKDYTDSLDKNPGARCC
ncbi:YbdD/YjiX family protein [Rothia sp. SD9660Na]|uniref:YbdD/YjiX family protein n=1 Tax=Rothia sp. SD9660Na TaxID=3047030 RepID=UPI0024B96EA9|nr:YbdD/YjiX family protein [Rothia sp. SD9660Na]WHS50687.1 YbdD/YjiX family protein [Rothia sp. SD9660Na]